MSDASSSENLGEHVTHVPDLDEPVRKWIDAVDAFRRRQMFPISVPLTEGVKDNARFPDLYIAGPQKTGTTWLAVQLQTHPQVFSPILKEIMYFDEYWGNGDLGWIQDLRRRVFHSVTSDESFSLSRLTGLWADDYLKSMRDLLARGDARIDDDWYSKFFSGCGVDQLCCDASATYSTLPRAALIHMRRLSPHAKIILTFRNPVDRIWSYLRMQMKLRNNFDKATRDAILEEHDVFLFQSSDYVTIVNKCRSVFGASNVLVLNYNDIELKPMELLKTICVFSGISPRPEFFYKAHMKIFEGPDVDMTHDTRERIVEMLAPIWGSLRNELPDLCGSWGI